MAKHFRLLLLFLVVLAVSCKKKTPEDIGLPILPGDDLLNAQFTDTVTLITHTVLDDSLATKNVAPILLGNMNDPVFGISKASIFTQLVLSKTNPVFGTGATLDSAVLSVVFSSGQYYGATDAQKFKVYELSDALSKDSTYYSNRILPYSTELGSGYIAPKPNPATDSIMIDTLKYPPHLRIHLDTNYFSSFLDLNNFGMYSGNTAFQSKFKGLYLASSSGFGPGQGGIFYMDLTNAYTRLTLFYHNSTDTSSYYFGVSKDGCTRFSHFEHDYSATTDIKAQIATDSTVQSDKVFVQPMAGVRTYISMPFLKDLYRNGKITINKAELILPVDPTSILNADSIFIPHSKLVATIADSIVGGPAIMPDYFEGATYFGGDYDKTKQEYRFNIARYVQQVLNGKRVDRGLYIITSNRPTTANRVQLMGGNQALPTHMKLKITYTPLY